MIKWSQAVLLAFHAMALLAGRREDVVSLDEAAASLEVSADHLSKVMQRLVKCGYIRSIRGRSGGYALASSPDDLTLLDIYECIEGKLEQRTCTLHEKGCDSKKCIFGSMLEGMNAQETDYLSKTKLADVALDGAVTG